jgi:hypothetical protein
VRNVRALRTRRIGRPDRAELAELEAVLADLQNRARREGRPTQELLVLYALERFLARLSATSSAGPHLIHYPTLREERRRARPASRAAWSGSH